MIGSSWEEAFPVITSATLILSKPERNSSSRCSSSGRLHRHHSSKSEVIIYDYVDSNVPVLAKMKERRLKGYHTIGYKL